VSVIDLPRIKRDLRVTHDEDDALLQDHLDAAEGEAVRFLNRTQLPTLPLDYPSGSSSEDVPSSDDPIAPEVFAAVCLLVRAKYDAATSDEIQKLRTAAETLLMPFRVGLGV